MPTTPARAPDAVDSVRVLAVVILGIAVALTAMSSLRGPFWAPAAAIEGLFLLGPLLYAAAVRLPIVDSFALRLPPARVVFFVLAACLGSMWLLSGLTILQDKLFVWLGWEQYARQSYTQLQKPVEEALKRGWFTAILLMSLAPGLCEEFLFRGLVFRGFQRSFSGPRALLYTALLFAAMHVELAKMIPMLFLGLFFGALAWLGRSLWMSVLAHAANNAAVLVVADLETRGHGITNAPGYVYPVSAVVFGLAMACLVREYRR